MRLSAFAKINLWLRVIDRRPDGYHEIDSRLVLLDLCDELEIERLDAAAKSTGGGEIDPRGNDLEFSCSDPSLPSDRTNLVIKAVEVLRRRVGDLPPMRIHLEKRIPHGAGLGGGSSDASATLVGVNRLLGLGLSVPELAGLAADVGSDAPFFAYRCACDCGGRGEIVTPRADFAESLYVLLIKPPFPVSTPWAYQSWKDSREIEGIRYSAQPFGWGSLVNDLERPVFARHLFLADLKMWLLDRPEVSGALLSGSGSTVFAVVRDFSRLEQLIDAVRREFGSDLWLHPARTLTGFAEQTPLDADLGRGRGEGRPESGSPLDLRQ